MPEDIAERMSKDMSERMSEDMSERMSEDMSEEMSERYVRRYVRNHVKRKVRKNVRRYVRKNVKRYVRKNGKRYVRKNVRRYKDSCLHLVVSILLFFALFGALQRRTAASTVGSTLFLCKEVSLVWQPWRRLWWNVLRRSSLGLPIRWPKELSMCGATSWLVLVLSACTCAWSRLALHMLGIWCLSWKKSWRETSGMWHMKGGLFQMRRASKSWRSALQSFVLRPRFGRMECMSGREMMCGARPPMQNRRKHRSGEHLISWFAHAMRCSSGFSNSFAFLDSTAFWRGGLLHWGQGHFTDTPWDVVLAFQTLLHFWTQLPFGGAVWCMWCVCVCGTTGVLHLWTSLPFGGAVRCTEGDDIYRHKVVMDITFAAWCEVNIEFAERLFVWSCGC